MNFYVKYRICLKKIQIAEKSQEMECKKETFINSEDCIIEITTEENIKNENNTEEFINLDDCKVEVITEDNKENENTAENMTFIIENEQKPVVNDACSSGKFYSDSYCDYENESKFPPLIVLHLSIKQLSEYLDKEPFEPSLPTITLSMAKILTNASITENIKSVKNAIFIVDYYLEQSFKSYLSHRKSVIKDIISMAPL